MMPWDRPNSAEMVPKVRPVDISKVVYMASWFGEPKVRHGIDADESWRRPYEKEDDEGGRRRQELGYRNERARSDEIEWREQSKGQRPQPSDEGVILANCSGQHHPDEIGRKDRLAVGPSGERAHSKQTEQQELGFEFGRPTAVTAEETRREPRQDQKTTTPTPRKTKVLIVKGAKMRPSATTVPRSVMKQAARIVLPYSVC